jgi:hypothetical protein
MVVLHANDAKHTEFSGEGIAQLKDPAKNLNNTITAIFVQQTDILDMGTKCKLFTLSNQLKKSCKQKVMLH